LAAQSAQPCFQLSAVDPRNCVCGPQPQKRQPAQRADGVSDEGGYKKKISAPLGGGGCRERRRASRRHSLDAQKLPLAAVRARDFIGHFPPDGGAAPRAQESALKITAIRRSRRPSQDMSSAVAECRTVALALHVLVCALVRADRLQTQQTRAQTSAFERKPAGAPDTRRVAAGPLRLPNRDTIRTRDTYSERKICVNLRPRVAPAFAYPHLDGLLDVPAVVFASRLPSAHLRSSLCPLLRRRA
jgi:hypothetical protein